MFETTERSVRNSSTEVEAIKDRLGISNYISLGGVTSLFTSVQSGVIAATGHYLLGKTQAGELINTMNSAASTLLTTHAQIEGLAGSAKTNAKTHWTKLAYRHQQIVKAINASAEKTNKLFKGRVSASQAQRLASPELGNPYLVAGVVVGVLAIWGVLAMVGAVIASAVKHYAEVNMYEKDIQATLETGMATGMVATRASKSDPILGGLSEFFGVINWKAILAVGVVGATGLLGYYYLKTKLTGAALKASLGDGGGRTKISKIKGDFPPNLVFDGHGHGLLIT